MRTNHSSCIFSLLLTLVCSQAFCDSIYRPSEYTAIVSDHRAKRVGDAVVVLVYEVASASNKTDFKSNKKTEVDVGATDNHNPVSASVSAENNSRGGGVEERSGEIMARISATVVDILPTGELVLRGAQRIALNNETQIIKVSGQVRPIDIDVNNSVLSTRLSEANIEFLGTGLLSSKQKPGLLSRMFDWLF